MLVTGGFGSDYLSSTELLVGTASAWVFTGELPSRRSGLRGANIENKVLMTGNKIYNDILDKWNIKQTSSYEWNDQFDSNSQLINI